ncbi:peptidylprolyl isomerase [Marinobacter salicampi]|uniref:peptidylprolyl isomerase n=1 Tax=Marinobacter salicampi TaxID=435907 RepID=UPI00140BB898|nr:hypothetical protein [Marinobacter salicampi]
MKNLILILNVGVFLVFTGLSQANEQETSALQEDTGGPGVFATVNGTALSVNLYHFLLGSREQESSERQAYDEGFDAQRHRQQTAKDLVMTELLAQEAARLGMKDSERVKAELAMAEKTLLAQLYVRKLMDSIEIDESRIRQAYDRKREQVMYRFMIWQTPDQDKATAILDSMKTGKGENAHEPAPIETPWLRAVDIAPEVDEIVRRLDVNEFAQAPVFQDGFWKVVQVIDKQVMAKQSYEEERGMIRSELVHQKLDEKLEELAEGAAIVFNEQLITLPEK